VMLAAYWFNPLAWWAARRMRCEVEFACDDRVVAGGARASAYADCMVQMAARMSRAGNLGWATPSMPFVSFLSWRIVMVLEKSRNRRSLGRVSLVCMATGALLAAGVVGAVQVARAQDGKVALPLVGKGTYAGTTTVTEGALVVAKDGKEESDADADARHLLDQKIIEAVAFNGDSLEAALNYVRDAAGANMVVLWGAIEKTGIKRDKPITQPLKQVSAATVLKTVLNVISADQTAGNQLAYTIENGVIVVSTRDDLAAHQAYAAAKAKAAKEGAAAASDADRKTLRLLGEKIIENAAFNGDSLETVLNFVRDATGSNMVVLWGGIEKAGIKRDRTVTQPLKHVSTAVMLKIVLDSASSGEAAGSQLDYVIEDGVVIIATRDDLAARKAKAAETK